MTDNDPTPVRSLLRAAEIGRNAGLHFVYAGNLPGKVGRWENTYCPSCDELLVERSGFSILRNMITDRACPRCHSVIPGVWE
jgi:pyruvate formate lyase activating enzyme